MNVALLLSKANYSSERIISYDLNDNGVWINTTAMFKINKDW